MVKQHGKAARRGFTVAITAPDQDHMISHHDSLEHMMQCAVITRLHRSQSCPTCPRGQPVGLGDTAVASWTDSSRTNSKRDA